MNILYITPYSFIPTNAGGKVAIFHQIKYLSKVANVVVAGLFTNSQSDKLDCKSLNIFKQSAINRYANPFLIFKLKKIIKEQKTDLIIIEHPYLGWLGIIFKKISNVKLAIRSQNVEYLRFKDLQKPWWKILKVYEKWVHNNADYVLCITELDKDFFANQGIKSKLINFPFGTEINAFPKDKNECKLSICKALNISIETKIIFYNGSLDYLPNQIGLDIILDKINPILLNKLQDYKIVICGNKLPEKYNHLKDYENKNIIYCGFVDDITTYFKGADLFINPVQGGGGIKTKLVEALASGTTTVSSANGANGLIQKVATEKLFITEDFNAEHMAEKIIELLKTNLQNPTPETYYDYYYWGNIVKKLLLELQ